MWAVVGAVYSCLVLISGKEAGVRYGFIIPKGDPRTVAELAREAEASGWDGAFYWDGIYVGEGWEVYDPWVVMAAVPGNSPARR